MATRMKQRRGTASQWTSTNNNQGPILEAGEIGYESDTGKFKIGDGANRWIALPYFLDESDLPGSLDEYLLISDIGNPLKAASLDADGKLPVEQLPDGIPTDSDISTAVSNAVSALVDGAPSALNTLNELAAALNDDASYAATITTALGTKASLTGTETLTNKTLQNPTITSLTTVPGTAETINVSGYADVYFGEMYGNNLSLVYNQGAPTVTGNTVTTNLDYGWNSVPVTITSPSQLSGFSLTITGNLGNGYPDPFIEFRPTANGEAFAAAVASLYGSSPNSGNIVYSFTGQTGAEQTVTSTISSTELKHLDGVTSAIQTQLDAKAPTANPTFTGTVAGVTKAHVGLGNVDNTSDANKPVSTATQTALDLKANLASPELTGNPTAPTQSPGNNSTRIATTAYADAAVAALVDSAPGALNTLNELAAALGDDENFATTLTNSLSGKAPLNSPTFTGTVDFTSATVEGIDALPTQSGNAGKYLTTDGTTASWAPAATETPHPFAMIG